MKLLFDDNPKEIARVRQKYSFIEGQLLTPLTRNSDAGLTFAIDNGAYSGFQRDAWLRLLERQTAASARCLFVTMPDVVGNARRTLECFHYWAAKVNSRWPLALVAQDGIENLPIPWELMQAVFIGGSTEWKMSQAAADVIRTGLIMEKHTHVGRINTPDRYLHFAKLGANTFDGSGVSRYDHMLDAIQEAIANDNRPLPLLVGLEGGDPVCAPVESLQQTG